MTISLRRLAAGGSVLATALAVAACGSTDNGTGSSSTSSGGLSVVAKDFSFTPTSVPARGTASLVSKLKNRCGRTSTTECSTHRGATPLHRIPWNC